MHIEHIDLWADGSAYLQAYVLNNSQEFRTNERRPVALICPGGAYLRTSDREAEPVAMRFAALGWHAFVLRYNTYYNMKVKDFQDLPPANEKSAYPQPLYDLAKAMITVRERADEWYVDVDRIAVTGFSAGGHLAASLGVHWNGSVLAEKFGADRTEWWKPNALVLGYPLLDYLVMKEEVAQETDEQKIELFKLANKAVFGELTPDDEMLRRLSPTFHVNEHTPPMFIWHTANDDLVYVKNSLNMAQALTKHKIPYELHIFEDGVHGLSLADETTGTGPQINADCQPWFDLAVTWLKKRF